MTKYFVVCLDAALGVFVYRGFFLFFKGAAAGYFSSVFI